MNRKDIPYIIEAACHAIRKNLHLEIYMIDLQITGNDSFKTYNPKFQFPRGVHSFHIGENIFMKVNDAETLYGVYNKVHNYKGKVSDKEFIVLSLAAWFYEVGKESNWW